MTARGCKYQSIRTLTMTAFTTEPKIGMATATSQQMIEEPTGMYTIKIIRKYDGNWTLMNKIQIR